MASLHGRVITITGAGSGIGLATARECASRGASLALCDINQEAVDKAVNELKTSSVNVIGRQVNVSNSNEVDAWIAEVVAHFGKLDGAANVAGVGGLPEINLLSNIVDTTNENWDFILGVNLTGMFYCVRAQLRVMQRGASIVNVASVAGIRGSPGLGAYSVSKHGVIGLTRTAAKEAGGRGIRVNALAPGPADTPLLAKIVTDAGATERPGFKDIALQRMGKAEEMAKTICFALSDDASYTTVVIDVRHTFARPSIDGPDRSPVNSVSTFGVVMGESWTNKISTSNIAALK